MPYSYLFLQLDYLRKRRLHSDPGFVRIFGLWCYPGGVYYSYTVPYRHERPKNPNVDCESL